VGQNKKKNEKQVNMQLAKKCVELLSQKTTEIRDIWNNW
jgi:hypothetical protein